MKNGLRWLAATLSVWFLAVDNGRACKVCYGAAESPIIEGMNLSIIFLLATTYFVLIGMTLTFFLRRRKALQTMAVEGEKS